jgi:hypothetical protein
VKDKARRTAKHVKLVIASRRGNDNEEDLPEASAHEGRHQPNAGEQSSAANDDKLLGGANAPFPDAGLSEKHDLAEGMDSRVAQHKHRSTGHMAGAKDRVDMHAARGESQPGAARHVGQQPAESNMNEDLMFKEAAAAARIAEIRKREQGHKLQTGSYVLGPDGKYVHEPSPGK